MKRVKRRVVAWMMMLCIMIGITGGVTFAADGDYSDVHGHWAQMEIESLIADGIVNGIAQGDTMAVNPSSLVTRGEFIKMLMVHDLGVDGYTEKRQEGGFGAPYTDITGHWAEDYILIAESLDYIADDSTGTFRPNNPITRADAIQMIVATRDEMAVAEYQGEAMFADVIMKSERNNDIYVANDNGIVFGYPDGSFKPQNYLTRAESMVIIYRLMTYVATIEEDPIAAAVPEEKSSSRTVRRPKYDLEVLTTTGGALTLDASGDYRSGTDVDIAVSSEEGYYFVMWTSSDGGTFEDANALETTFEMPRNDTTITANFISEDELTFYTLDVVSSTGGALEFDISGDYLPGVTLDVSAVADEGYSFIGWDASSGSFSDATSSSTQYIMPAENVTLTALFDEEDMLGTLVGSVVLSTVEVGFEGAEVVIYDAGGVEYARTYTGETGGFTLPLPAGEYRLVIMAEGYGTITSYEVVSAGVTTYTSAFVLIPYELDESLKCDINIQVLNAFTGDGLEGVTVYFRKGYNNYTGDDFLMASDDDLFTLQTDSDGYMDVTVPIGQYTIECTLDGYTVGYANVLAPVVGAYEETQYCTLTPVLEEGETRVVLSWGSEPEDLDSHMTGPIAESTDRFHVYYSSTNYILDDVTYCNLDVDDTSSYGPETITIYKSESGTYRYSVFDFSNQEFTESMHLTQSSATVKVYQGSILVATFNVPTDQTGTLWTVFELEVDEDNTVEIIPINSITEGASSSTIQ